MMLLVAVLFMVALSQGAVPCKDRSNQCAYYKSTGWYVCGVGSYMYDYCKKTCGYCNGGLIPTPKSGCHDFEKNCKTWVKMGECQSNTKFMSQYCCKSCQGVTPTKSASTTKSSGACKDKSNQCAYYKSTGWYVCGVGSYMYDYCKKTCGYCNGKPIPTPKPGCHDFEKNCSSWVKMDQCKKNRMFMSKYCCKACKR
ncbi:zinc metalloproteinase nas-14-like [Hydractinia symbiolongicarpus]|uniref:zinc metalloproteinase nas-14-like n=1 Tax=Hydractinia symbiolongicarpus TaxID=13093 RepID=UPI00254E9979|nr:zinc metalloproteinase nas-14-like [Hydractinia symbiolongicarpus]